MPIRAVTITKTTSFRGKQVPFSNTYFFYNEVGGTDYDGLIDPIVTMEKKLHSSDVTFKTARLWSAGGNQAQNEMLRIKDLSGTGQGAANSSMDRERCVLVQWDCGRNILGRKVYLRKWYHVCGSPVGTTLSATGVLAQTSQIDANTQDTIKAIVDDVNTIGVLEGLSWQLCSPKGVTYKSEPNVYDWLEHHQLGESWRN